MRIISDKVNTLLGLAESEGQFYLYKKLGPSFKALIGKANTLEDIHTLAEKIYRVEFTDIERTSAELIVVDGRGVGNTELLYKHNPNKVITITESEWYSFVATECQDDWQGENGLIVCQMELDPSDYNFIIEEYKKHGFVSTEDGGGGR